MEKQLNLFYQKKLSQDVYALAMTQEIMHNYSLTCSRTQSNTMYADFKWVLNGLLCLCSPTSSSV
jgi:hypothetical protein